MPVGLVRKWTVVAIIAASLGVIACKDDDEDPVRDAGGGTPGGQDSGGSPGGGVDSGTDSGGGTGGTDGGRSDGGGMSYGEAGTPCMGWDGGPVTCGTNTCYWHRTPLTCSNPGCIVLDGGASICAIDTNTLGGVDAGLPAWLPYNAPGVASPQCANLVDSFEDSGTGDAGTRGNGRIDVAPRMVSGLTIALSYEGCCTPTGYCSGDVGKGLAAIQGAGGAPNPSNAGYGCLDNRIFFSTSPAAQQLRCNPQTGDLVSSDGGASDGGSDAGAGDAGAGDGG